MKLFNRGRFEPNTGAPRARMSLSAVLIYFVVVLSLFTGITYASYSSTASGTATATVAKFAVEASGSTADDAMSLKIGEADSTGTYSLTVTNKSEVKISNSVVFSNVPVGVTVTCGSQTQTAGTDGKVTFTGIGTINAVSGSTTPQSTYSFTFKAPEGVAEVSGQSVTVSVTAEQTN